MANGRSLELFYVDGVPDGMLTAEVFNWTGHILVTSRTQITEALKRREAGHTGVYILLGEREGQPYGYIGESDDIRERIWQHDTKKEWWSKAVLITSSANNLNKAHVKYLEARLINTAKATGKMILDNALTPSEPNLSEAGLSDMEVFFENILFVLPALRIDQFQQNKRPSLLPHADSEVKVIETFELNTKKHDLNAVAKLMENGEFVVQAGSRARRAWEGRGSEESSYGQLHAELVRSGVLQEAGENRVFSDNYAFTSPSAAGAVVNGRPTNGTVEWKVLNTDQTYKQWEVARLAREYGETSEGN